MNNLYNPYSLVMAFITVVGSIVIIFITGFAIDNGYYEKQIDIACQNQGRDYHGHGTDFSYCISENGEADFVVIDCDGLFWNKKCVATIIDIGEARVK